MMPNKEAWTFSAGDSRVQLEDSVYLAGNDGPRRAAQIVINGHARIGRRAWSGAFTQTSAPPAAAAGTARRVREEEPRLPL